MTFQNENEYLIHLLYCAIHNTVPETIPDHISLENVFAIGAKHEVANLAYTAVKKIEEQVPGELMARWREFYYNAVKRDSAQRKARTEILDALHSHGIDTLEVQGTVVKRYYPQSHLRMMSDIDVIIPEDKLDEAAVAMRSIGYETEFTHKNAEIFALKKQIDVELHTDFFISNQVVYQALDRPFTLAAVGDDHTATVTDTVFYLFHLLHTIKHATEYKGVGIRRVVDLYYLEEALRDKADLSYIDGVLKKYGFYDVKKKLIAVKDHWFCGIRPKMDVASFEEEIMEAENHGTEEIYNKNLDKLYERRFLEKERGEGKRFVRIRYLLNFLFPPKKDIYQSYPFCEKHRYPVVLCWIHRWIFSVFNKEKRENCKSVFSVAKTKLR